MCIRDSRRSLTGGILLQLLELPLIEQFDCRLDRTDGVEPVSYTHLDVYKRQLYIHAAGEGHRGESMAQIMEANTLLNTRVRQQFPVDPGHRVRAPVAAGAGRREQDGIVGVLFMLDVYKRQVYSASIFCTKSSSILRS